MMNSPSASWHITKESIKLGNYLLEETNGVVFENFCDKESMSILNVSLLPVDYFIIVT